MLRGRGNPNDLSSFFETFKSYVQHESEDLSILFKNTPQSPTENVEGHLRRIQNLTHETKQKLAFLEAAFQTMLAHHFSAFLAHKDGDYELATEEQTKCLEAFLKTFRKETSTVWLLPTLFAILSDLRIFAKRADRYLRSRSKKPSHVEKAAPVIRDVFVKCLNRAPEIQKKMAALRVVNLMFQIYFELNTIGLCKNLIAAVEDKSYPDLEEFPIAQQVTYKFFIGKLAIFAGDYTKAQAALSLAFNKCPRLHPNKRTILLYLIPVEMLFGKLPSTKLLKKYQVSEYFLELVIAVKQGHVQNYILALKRHEEWFIKIGVYLVLERVKMLVYRSLIKHIYEAENKANQIKLGTRCLPILHWMGVADIDIEQLECYISHKHCVLVVSNQHPFPPLKTIRF